MSDVKILISTGGGDPSNYVRAVRLTGGDPDPVYLPAPAAGGYAGLILAGGEDMDPALFGQPNRGSRGIDLARDRAELALLSAFLEAGKPVLGICRGLQVANVWAGGDLIQDLGEGLNPFHQRQGDAVHPVRAVPGSRLERLYGTLFPVNSNHHQAAGRLGQGLQVTARSESGVVEGVEHGSLPLMCVQFHPERMMGELARPDTVNGEALFADFIMRCASR